MKRFFTLFLLIFSAYGLTAQVAYAQNFISQNRASHNKNVDFDGQWKGGFDEGGFGVPGYDDDIQYVLELNTEGSQVSGYSYTYFHEGPKRYYTICRLTGTLNRATNDLVVTEVERTKYNTPPDFQNCFQTHRLHYERDSGMEILKGTWVAAPNQGPGCGSGTTVLSRRVVDPLPLGYMPHPAKPLSKSLAKARPPAKKPAYRSPSVASAHSTKPKVPQKMGPPREAIIHNPGEVESLTAKRVPDLSPIEAPETLTPITKGFERRRKDIVKTIAITQPTFKLDFYDNGEIDGDSISVFYNGKVVLSHQRLSDKPISLTLTLDKNVPENVVTMYADNLGTIPPNTALMVVTDGARRYEVRIESDTQKSGSVVFKAAQ